MTKPIAWMALNELLFNVVKDEIYHIPLYTHPMRELTDEEIEGIARANVDGHTSMEQLKWFARAILKKAGEK